MHLRPLMSPLRGFAMCPSQFQGLAALATRPGSSGAKRNHIPANSD
jgi:hypothetical protein